MKKNYNTKQKDKIIEVINRFDNRHFTAEQVFKALKEDNASIGISTVYRHLDKLAVAGEVQKLASIAGESACYQRKGCADNHFHLKCINCGSLEHLSCEKLMDISKHVALEHDFIIDSSKTVFYGLCHNCQGENVCEN